MGVIIIIVTEADVDVQNRREHGLVLLRRLINANGIFVPPKGTEVLAIVKTAVTAAQVAIVARFLGGKKV